MDAAVQTDTVFYANGSLSAHLGEMKLLENKGRIVKSSKSDSGVANPELVNEYNVVSDPLIRAGNGLE